MTAAARRGPGNPRGGAPVRQALRRVLLVAGLPLALLALWRVASADSQSFYLPPLREILQTFASTWPGARLVDDVLPSVARLLAGFALVAVLGVGVNLAARALERRVLAWHPANRREATV